MVTILYPRTAKGQMLAQMAYAMGGRAAEEIFTGTSTTGASNDFEKATQIARDMVTKYGYGSDTGLAAWSSDDKMMSESTRSAIDREVITLLNDAMATARRAITVNKTVLSDLVGRLVEHETINGSELDGVIAKVSAVD
jgi:cell division protease FtsH